MTFFPQDFLCYMSLFFVLIMNRMDPKNEYNLLNVSRKEYNY